MGLSAHYYECYGRRGGKTHFGHTWRAGPEGGALKPYRDEWLNRELIADGRGDLVDRMLTVDPDGRAHHWKSPLEVAMKPERAEWQDEKKTVPQSACSACGQPLPFKVGDVVEGMRYGKTWTGVVSRINGGGYVDILGIGNQAAILSLPVKGLVRLHGYFRILEREAVR
jgi:hypothetical protein